MAKSIPVLLILFFAILCLGTSNVAAQISKNVPHHEAAIKQSQEKLRLTYVIINSEQNTFGYDILNHNRPMIHQPSIPGMRGNKGFTTKKDAAKVAKLVIKKIHKNIMPPSVTMQELKHLKIKI